MSSVSKFYENIVKNKAETDLRKQGEDKRLTIILSEYDYGRLAVVSEQLNEKVSALARNFIILSLDDVENILKEKNDFSKSN